MELRGFPDSKRWLAAALLAVALVPSAWLAWRWRTMPQLGLYHDDGLYFVTGKAWATGHGHRILSFPGTPAQTKYPPALPLLLSLVWRARPDFPANLPLAALVAWAMLPLLLAAAGWWFAEAGFSRRQRRLFCLWLAVNPALVTFSLLTMSELLFAALLAAAMAAAERASRRESSPRWAALAGLLAAGACLTRSPALLLLGTVPFGYLLRRQKRRAMLFAGAMAPAVAGWQIWMVAHRPPSNDIVALYYLAYLKFHLATVALADVPHLFLVNLNALLTGVANLLFFLGGATFPAVTLARVVSLVALVGTGRWAWRSGKLQFPLFAAGYVAVLLVWHGTPGPRFLLPLAPLLMGGFASESSRLLAQVGRAWRRPERGQQAAAVAAILLLGWFGLHAARRMEDGLAGFVPGLLRSSRARLAASRGAWRWIRRNTAPGARVLAYADPLVYLYTGRKALSVRVPPAMIYRNRKGEIERFIAGIPKLMREYRLRYALLTRADFRLDGGARARAAFRKLVTTDPSFRLVYHDGYASLYRFRESGTITRR